MVRLGIAVTTAPRPRPTLTDSLDSLRDAGFRQPVLVSADGVVPALRDDGIEVIQRAARLTVLQHWVETLRSLLAWSDADRLCILQDDVTWSAGSAAVVEATWDRLAPFWTWYVDPGVARNLERVTKRTKLRPGAYLSHMGIKSNGALCYGLARTLAMRVLESHRLAEWLVTRERGIDKRIPAICLDLGQPLQVWVPGLVNHALGAGNSAIKPKAPKDTAYWRPAVTPEIWLR